MVGQVVIYCSNNRSGEGGGKKMRLSAGRCIVESPDRLQQQERVEEGKEVRLSAGGCIVRNCGRLWQQGVVREVE